MWANHGRLSSASTGRFAALRLPLGSSEAEAMGGTSTSISSWSDMVEVCVAEGIGVEMCGKKEDVMSSIAVERLLFGWKERIDVEAWLG